MNPIFYFLITIVPFAAIAYLTYSSFKKKTEGKPVKKIMAVNAGLFVALFILAALLTFTVSAAEAASEPSEISDTSASDGGTTTTETTDNSKGLGLLAAGLVTAISGIGGGIAVAAGAPAAIAATSEDPKVFGKALIFVALGESIALYGVVISILILNKI